MPSLPSNGAWMLSAGPGGAIPPFVRLTVDFDRHAGSVQGLRQSQSTPLSSVTTTSPGNFRATYVGGGVPVTFTGTLAPDGGLTLSFLTPKPMTCTASPIAIDWDAGSIRIGSQNALAMVAKFEQNPQPGKFTKIARAKVAFALRMTIKSPRVEISQGDNNLCGPTSFMYVSGLREIRDRSL